MLASASDVVLAMAAEHRRDLLDDADQHRLARLARRARRRARRQAARAAAEAARTGTYLRHCA